MEHGKLPVPKENNTKPGKPVTNLKKDGNQIGKSATITKKQNLEIKLKRMKQDPCFPLYLIVICKICFIIPISIYVCDVLIGINVMEDYDFSWALVNRPDNYFNDSSAPLLSIGDYPYEHKFRNTILKKVQEIRRDRSPKTSLTSSEGEQVEVLIKDNETSTIPETTTFPQKTFEFTTPPSINGTSSLLSASTYFSTMEGTVENSTLTRMPAYLEVTTLSNETLQTSNTSTTTTEPLISSEHEGQYCESTIYFIQQHENMARKASKQEVEYDWYNNMIGTLYKYQQALFFMFTVIGFIFLLTSIGLRADAFLREKWSSSLLLTFLLYMISMSLTAKVFALQSGSNGLRCFLCRMVSFCDDINPWDLTAHEYFPTEMNWNTTAFVSIILKVYDSICIGAVTLRFIVDPEVNPWWAITIKVVGWIVIFPVMVITPVAGVIRYIVLPVTGPGNRGLMLAFTIIFYIGVVFWGMVLLILPLFCYLFMCDNNVDVDEDEEY